MTTPQTTPTVIPPEKRKVLQAMLSQAEGEDLKQCWEEVQAAIKPILDKYNAKLSYIEVRQGGQLVQSNIVVVKRN